MYNVLWIDDEHNDKELIYFVLEAKKQGLYLHGYPSFEEGFEALENNLEKYDVILLDGLFFEKKGQEAGTEDESGIGMAIARINELKSKKVFPWFVLSGKDTFTKSENSILKANKVLCFDKTNPSDVIKLFEEIKKAAKTQSDFQLKHQYNNILEICNDKYIGANQFKRVFSLIKDIEAREEIVKTGDLFNPIRKIIEALFGKLRMGMPDRPIIRDPQYIDEADYLVIESTYGDKDHPPMKESTEKLIEIINKTAERGGTVLIPSFAVGRTQELIYELNRYYEYNDIKPHLEVPIYIDSPMAINATEVFQNNAGTFDQETTDLILKGDNPFTFNNLNYVRSVEESIALNESDIPKVIISASGMATAGRIRHHLKHNLWNPKNSLVFVGYQAEGSLGRILLDGAKKVKLLGEEIHVGLEIYDLEGFSAHADRTFMLNWIEKIEKKPKKVFIVHGERETAKAFSNQIEERFGLKTIIPKMGNSYRVAIDAIEVEKGMTIEPEILREDIAKELQVVYEEFNSLMSRSNGLFEEKLLENDYDLLKNRLLDLQSQLMDLNILIGK